MFISLVFSTTNTLPKQEYLMNNPKMRNTLKKNEMLNYIAISMDQWMKKYVLNFALKMVQVLQGTWNVDCGIRWIHFVTKKGL